MDPLAEWTVAAVLKYVSRMDKVEAEFRRCAYADDAPLDCPVFSELTTHKTLWNSGSTVGIVGFGAVGKVRVVIEPHTAFGHAPAPLKAV